MVMTNEEIQRLIIAAETGNFTDIQEQVNVNTDWMMLPVNKEQVCSIHLAAGAGLLNAVKFLLNKSPNLLNVIDVYGGTPLYCAVIGDQEKVVEYLIELGADLTLTINRPGKAEHGRTPLTQALASNYNAVASRLILKAITPQNQDEILSLINTDDLVIELMSLEPAMVKMLLENERITQLLLQGAQMTEDSIKYYKPKESHLRRPSFFINIDRNTGISCKFEPQKILGRSDGNKSDFCHGTEVRLFINTNTNQKLAVKSTDHNFSILWPLSSRKNKIQRQYSDFHREAEFNQKAYPEDTLTFEFLASEDSFYGNRLLTHYVSADDADTFISKITCPQQLAEIVYTIARELHRLHTDPNIGIIHCDIKSRHIKVDFENNKFYARFIDFGASHYTHEKHLRFSVSSGNCFAPELRMGACEKPETNQDVYSLGYMFDSVFDRHSSRQQLMQKFPSIENFILESQNEGPTLRPLLQQFCEKLSDELKLTMNNDESLKKTTSSVSSTPQTLFHNTTEHSINVVQEAGVNATGCA